LRQHIRVRNFFFTPEDGGFGGMFFSTVGESDCEVHSAKLLDCAFAVKHKVIAKTLHSRWRFRYL
jgi:hypothetical protein